MLGSFIKARTSADLSPGGSYSLSFRAWNLLDLGLTVRGPVENDFRKSDVSQAAGGDRTQN